MESVVAIEIINTAKEFFRTNVEIFFTLVLAALGGIYWIISNVIKRQKNLNKIYLVHNKKSSSINLIPLSNRKATSNYFELDEYKALKSALERGEHVLVTGAPLSGKTMAIFQALKKLNPTANITIPRLQDIDMENFKVPFNFSYWRRNILVLDDVDKFIDKQNFKFMVDEFLKKQVVIVASCRSGMEFENKLLKAEWLYPIFNKESIIEFPGNIPDEKGKEIAGFLNVDWNPAAFDGKIGSLIIQLEPMKNKFNDCSTEEKAILKCIRLLYKAGIYKENENFSLKNIQHLCKELFGISFEKYRIDEVFSILDKKNFIKTISDEVIWAEEAYLVYVVEPNEIEGDPIDFFIKIKNCFSEDWEALLSIGNRAYNIGLIDINKKYFMKISIAAYEEALKITTLDRFPMQYAMTQNNIGNAYGTLGEVENKVQNCKKSIVAFEEALKVTTFDRFPMDYAMTQNNIGTAYGTLGDVENQVENCRKAIAAFEEALKVTTFDRFPMRYAMTQNNIGVTYRKLGEVENKVENCRKAIAAFEEALKVTTLDRFPMDYAMTQNNIGTAYGTLGEVENKAENCKKSIAAFEEALKVRTLDRFPMQYAMTQNNIGATYRKLGEVENKAENCRKAIAAYEEALKVRTLDRFPMQYAITQNNIGNAYRTLSEVENKVENCRKAIATFEEALKVTTFDRFPMQYAMTQNNIGNAYGTLGEVENKAENCRKAIAAYEEALKVTTLDRFPMDYAMTQNNLGTAYETFGEVENKVENCRKAIAAYEKALKIFTKDEFPEPYKTISKNLEMIKILYSGNIVE